ncbi:MAG: hypothetical protein ACR2PL_09315, partial [Dehalococcoidia bacterium]
MVPVTNLRPEQGYWVYFASATTARIRGRDLHGESCYNGPGCGGQGPELVSVSKGQWVMVGNPTNESVVIGPGSNGEIENGVILTYAA